MAVVTGGNGGIGLGMAKGMALAGATVVVAGRNAEKNDAAVAELKAIGAKASAIAVDVLQEDSCRALVSNAVKAHGRLDILVNNAGINIRKQPQEYTLAEWHQVLDSNLTSAFLCSHAAYPEMKKGGGGKMINIGSMMSIFGASFTTAYAASKGGIVQMTKAMATAWARDNIQVNSILPGWIDTRPHPAGTPRRAGPARFRAEPHAGRPLGHAGGFRRHRGLPGRNGLGLRHGRRHHRRRRILGPGIGIRERRCRQVARSTNRVRLRSMDHDAAAHAPRRCPASAPAYPRQACRHW